MDTPAAALMRLTDTPSCPNSLRQRRVASTNASRRNSGVARWNFGTCRLVAIDCPFFRDYTQARPNGAYGSMSIVALGLRRPAVDEGADSIGHIAPDVEIPVLHRRVESLGVHTRPNSILHTRTYRPVLAVDQVPEIHGIGRIEARLRHFMCFEQKMARDIGAFGAARLQDECRDMIAGHAQE